MADGLMFSIVTPTWNRLDGRLERCMRSVAAQETDGFEYEHIVVDDGSTDGTFEWFKRLYNKEAVHWPHLVYVPAEHQGRVIARNKGMKAAEGEWIVWLDSDDALDPMYLATCAHYIRKRPKVDLWVTGAIVHGLEKGEEYDCYGGHGPPKWTRFRRPWVPPLDKSGEHVHKLFRSGHVGTGMFVFRKTCLDVTGYLPPWRNHNETADGMNEWLGLKPGDKWYDYWGSAHRLVGNPHGDDHAFFARLCLDFEAHILASPGRRDPPCLYVHYMR